MSRNRHKRSHEREKFKKKTRSHRIRYGKGRFDIEEESTKASVWSRWLNFIRTHWCGKVKKTKNPLDMYTEALSAEVFDIPVEPKRHMIRTEMAPEDCGDGPRRVEAKSHFLHKKDRKFHEKKSDLRWLKNSEKSTVKDDVMLTSNIYFHQNIQSTHFGEPDMWNRPPLLKKSSQKLVQMCLNRTRNQLPEHSIEDINKSFSEPSWSEKTKIYHRRQVQADINNLLDQLMCMQQDFYAMQYKEPNCKKRVKFGFPNSPGNQKKPQGHKISRQVSPEVLVNIKPFKKQLKRNLLERKISLTSTPGDCSLNTQVKEMRREEPEININIQQKPVEKEISFQIHSSMLRNPVLIPKNLANTKEIHKHKPTILEKIVEQTKSKEPINPDVVRSLREDFCLVFGVYRSYNEIREQSSKKSLDEVLESFDDKDHDLVFKKNISQFRRKISFVPPDKKAKVEDSIDDKPKEEPERKIRKESLQIQKIARARSKWKIILKTKCDLLTLFESVRDVCCIMKKVDILNILQRMHWIHQLHESNTKILIQKRFPNDTTLVVRETRAIRSEDLKTMRTFRELKYCLRDVGAVAKVLISPDKRTSSIIILTHDRSKPKQTTNPQTTNPTTEKTESTESQENIIDLLAFMQEYSNLIERNYGCEEFIEIEKILSSVAKSFSSLGLADSESENEVEIPPVLKVAAENLSKCQTAIQILNYSCLEYAAVIYDSIPRRRACEKSFSEPDIHKELRQIFHIYSDTCLVEDYAARSGTRRSLRQTISVDGFRSLFDGWEAPKDEEEEKSIMRMIKYWESAPDKKKKKNSTFITCMGETKMQTCKSDSFPGQITFPKGYRAQRSLDMFRDLYKDFKKKRKTAEKWSNIKNRLKSVRLESEKGIKFENDGGKLPPDEMKYSKGNPGKKMFFIEKNSDKLSKEVVAAFSIIKDLKEEKSGSKMSVVILLCKK